MKQVDQERWGHDFSQDTDLTERDEWYGKENQFRLNLRLIFMNSKVVFQVSQVIHKGLDMYYVNHFSRMNHNVTINY